MARLDAARVSAWRDLQSIGAAVERRIDEVLTAEWQVPLGWFDVLAALQRLGGRARPSELADELRLVRSSLSRRLDRLEEEGWVARSRPTSRDDHRAVVVELTPRGRTLWREMNVTYRRALQLHVSSQLSENDIGDLRRILGNLAIGLATPVAV
jgi:DNA-binding MarR family transcriptional regulator